MFFIIQFNNISCSGLLNSPIIFHWFCKFDIPLKLIIAIRATVTALRNFDEIRMLNASFMIYNNKNNANSSKQNPKINVRLINIPKKKTDKDLP